MFSTVASTVSSFTGFSSLGPLYSRHSMVRSSNCSASCTNPFTARRTLPKISSGAASGSSFRAASIRSAPKSSFASLFASGTPSVYRKILEPGFSCSSYSRYRTPLMPPMTRPCLSFSRAKLPPGSRITGYSWPALAALSLPVEISRMPSQTVTNICSWLLEQTASLVLVKMAAGPCPSMAQLCRMILEAIMNRAAGMPLPDTSAMIRPR